MALYFQLPPETSYINNAFNLYHLSLELKQQNAMHAKASEPLPRESQLERMRNNLGGMYIWRLQNFHDFWPPPPIVCILDQFIVLNSRNHPYYICFWGTPFPPPTADVICTCPLTGWFSRSRTWFVLTMIFAVPQSAWFFLDKWDPGIMCIHVGRGRAWWIDHPNQSQSTQGPRPAESPSRIWELTYKLCKCKF